MDAIKYIFTKRIQVDGETLVEDVERSDFTPQDYLIEVVDSNPFDGSDGSAGSDGPAGPAGPAPWNSEHRDAENEEAWTWETRLRPIRPIPAQCAEEEACPGSERERESEKIRRLIAGSSWSKSEKR